MQDRGLPLSARCHRLVHRSQCHSTSGSDNEITREMLNSSKNARKSCASPLRYASFNSAYPF
jgi:hypothetical protein